MSSESALVLTLLASMALNLTLVLAGGMFLAKVLKRSDEARERERRDLAEIFLGKPLERDVEVVKPGDLPEIKETEDDDLVAAFNRAEKLG